MDELASFLIPCARLDVKLLALQQAGFNHDACNLISNDDGAELKGALKNHPSALDNILA